MNTKRCNNCNTNKPLIEFYKKQGKYRTPCKQCARSAGLEYIRDPHVKNKRLINNQNFYRRNKELKTKWLYSLLENSECIDCHETDPIVLEFDHIRGFKYKGIAQLVSSLFSLERLQEEIEKCDIVCANCHRRRTVQRCGGHRYLHFTNGAR